MGVSRAGILSDGAAIAQAARRMDESLTVNVALADADECAQLRDMDSWSDAKLIAAVRRDPPDEAALNALVDRYWKPLFGRCQVLALNHQKASDLAQEAWCRVLRARQMLKPDGNFPAYLDDHRDESVARLESVRAAGRAHGGAPAGLARRGAVQVKKAKRWRWWTYCRI